MPVAGSTLDTLVKNGLPAWVYTWRTVALLFVFGPIAMWVVMSLVGTIWTAVFGQSRHAPDCYTMNLAGPAVAGSRPFDLDDDAVAKVAASRHRNMSDVAAAIRACQPDACSAEQRQVYRKAVLAYVGDRGHAAQWLYLRSGDAGLVYAEQLYGTVDDEAIVSAVRQGFEAGLLDIGRLRSNDEIVRMVLFKPLAELALCKQPAGHTCPVGRATC